MTSGRPLVPSDLDLLHRAVADPEGRRGRQAASDLLERYQRRVYLWCFRHVRDHERALDLAQEVLVKAYRSLPSFEGRADFGSWIFAIARNRCLSELRRPHLALEVLDDSGEYAAAGPDPETELLENLDEEETLALINAHLDPTERSALWLRCFDRTPVDEITTVLGITDASGARAVLQRARRKLQRALDERDARSGGDRQ